MLILTGNWLSHFSNFVSISPTMRCTVPFSGIAFLNCAYCTLAVWLSGNALALINIVALHQTRLVLGWVTVCGRVKHFGM